MRRRTKEPILGRVRRDAYGFLGPAGQAGETGMAGAVCLWLLRGGLPRPRGRARLLPGRGPPPTSAAVLVVAVVLRVAVVVVVALVEVVAVHLVPVVRLVAVLEVALPLRVLVLLCRRARQRELGLPLVRCPHDASGAPHRGVVPTRRRGGGRERDFHRAKVKWIVLLRD